MYYNHNLVSTKTSKKPLQRTGQDSLNYISTTTNHRFSRRIKQKKGQYWKVIFIVNIVNNQQQLIPIPFVTRYI